MSKNRNRAKLNKAKSSKEYKCLLWWSVYGRDYWDWGWNFSYGDFPNHKWRSYKTWKHNRKTQWK
jgi:hypothetical protein